jgi:hypothetical protein
VQQAFTYENLNAWTYGTISERNWLLEEAWISIHWFWGLQFWWCVHIISCGGFSQSLSPAEDHLWSWCCSLSTHVQFRFSSFSSWTINKLPICTKPLIQKSIHTNTKVYKCPQSHLFTADWCFIFFSIVINDYVQAGRVRISCSAKGYGQIANRFCSRISFEEPNSSLLILCR